VRGCFKKSFERKKRRQKNSLRHSVVVQVQKIVIEKREKKVSFFSAKSRSDGKNPVPLVEAVIDWWVVVHSCVEMPLIH
jgi:hypothetical protein